MKLINRCVITLKPTSDFIEWVTKLEIELPETWEFEGGAYLVDEQESEEQLFAAIGAQAQTILANEFSVWTEDQKKWPTSRDFNALKRLFTLHTAVATFDLAKEPLLRADLS